MKLKILLTALVLLGLTGCVSSGIDLYEQQKDLAKAARINTKLGAAYMQQGNYSRAKKKLQKAIKQDPDHAAAHSTLARLYSKQELADRAREQYQRALELAPNDPSLHNQYATFLCMQKQYKKAHEHFMRAAHDPSYITPQVAWTNAGVCRRSQNESEKAAAYFRKALQLNPKYTPAILQLAGLSLQRGNDIQANALMAHYNKFAEPTATSLLLQVRIYHELGKQKKALSYAHKLEAQFPVSKEVSQLGQALGL